MIRNRRGAREASKKVALGAVLLVAPPLALAQAVNDTTDYWLKVAIVALVWVLGVGLGTVLSGDMGSKDERGGQN
jgi:hypothetical protein